AQRAQRHAIDHLAQGDAMPARKGEGQVAQAFGRDQRVRHRHRHRLRRGERDADFLHPDAHGTGVVVAPGPAASGAGWMGLGGGWISGSSGAEVPGSSGSTSRRPPCRICSSRIRLYLALVAVPTWVESSRMVGRMNTISMRWRFSPPRVLNSSPSSGMRPRKGTRVSLREEELRTIPPSTMVWPFSTRILVSS